MGEAVGPILEISSGPFLFMPWTASAEVCNSKGSVSTGTHLFRGILHSELRWSHVLQRKHGAHVELLSVLVGFVNPPEDEELLVFFLLRLSFSSDDLCSTAFSLNALMTLPN